MLARLEKAGLAATRALSVAGLAGLMGLAALTLADGLMRWLANQPIEGVRDLGALAIAVAVASCLPVGLMERGNITMRFMGKLFGARTGKVFDALAAIVVEGVLVLMAWQFFLYAAKLAKGHETTWVLKIPTAPFWYVVDAMLWCAVVVQAIVVALEIGRVFGHETAGAQAPVLH